MKSKETYQNQKRPIKTKRDQMKSKETYQNQKRPIKIKRDLSKSKETWWNQKRPDEIKRETWWNQKKLIIESERETRDESRGARTSVLTTEMTFEKFWQLGLRYMRLSTRLRRGILGWLIFCWLILVDEFLSWIQPIAIGFSINLNLQSRSDWSLFNGSRQKRRRELDFSIELCDCGNDPPNAILSNSLSTMT